MKPQPILRSDTKVPLCSYRACVAYDGKRCQLMGCAPSTVCEPEVERLVKALELLLSSALCDCGYDPENDNTDYHLHSADCMSAVSARIRKGDY